MSTVISGLTDEHIHTVFHDTSAPLAAGDDDAGDTDDDASDAGDEDATDTDTDTTDSGDTDGTDA